MFKLFSIICFISPPPFSHLLNRTYWQNRRGQFLFLSAATCLSIFMLPKQTLTQLKQMEGDFQKRWDFKTINLLGSRLVPSFPWKQEFVGICRCGGKPETPLLLLPSVCIQGCQVLLAFDDGSILPFLSQAFIAPHSFADLDIIPQSVTFSFGHSSP